jgi:hypothetical protein
LPRIITDTRAERALQARQEAKARWSAKWVGWRVFAIDIQDAGFDGRETVLAYCEPLVAPLSITQVFEFTNGAPGKRWYPRCDAFLVACGVTEQVVEARTVEGRYFAARNQGENPSDFGPLSLALQAAA